MDGNECSRLVSAREFLDYLRFANFSDDTVGLFEWLSDIHPAKRLLHNISRAKNAAVAAGRLDRFDYRAILLGKEYDAYSELIRNAVPDNLMAVADDLLDIKWRKKIVRAFGAEYLRRLES